MTLNHLNLSVEDVPELVAFLEQYTGMRRTGGNDGLSVLTDDSGFVLTLMKAKGGIADYPGFFHIGLVGLDKNGIDELQVRLSAEGYETTTPSDHHGYTFYVMAPGRVRIEFLA